MYSLRQGGQQKTEHGYESNHHAAVLPHIIHTLLQQVQDPRGPVHTQRPSQRLSCPVGGRHVRTLPGEARGGHGETLALSTGCRISPPAAAASAASRIVSRCVFTLATETKRDESTLTHRHQLNQVGVRRRVCKRKSVRNGYKNHNDNC